MFPSKVEVNTGGWGGGSWKKLKAVASRKMGIRDVEG